MKGLNLEDIVKKENKLGLDKESATDIANIIYNLILNYNELLDFGEPQIYNDEQGVYRRAAYEMFCLARKHTNNFGADINKEIIQRFNRDGFDNDEVFEDLDANLKFEVFKKIESYEKKLDSPYLLKGFFIMFYCSLHPTFLEEYEAGPDLKIDDEDSNDEDEGANLSSE